MINHEGLIHPPPDFKQPPHQTLEALASCDVITVKETTNDRDLRYTVFNNAGELIYLVKKCCYNII